MIELQDVKNDKFDKVFEWSKRLLSKQTYICYLDVFDPELIYWFDFEWEMESDWIRPKGSNFSLHWGNYSVVDLFSLLRALRLRDYSNSSTAARNKANVINQLNSIVFTFNQLGRGQIDQFLPSV